MILIQCPIVLKCTESLWKNMHLKTSKNPEHVSTCLTQNFVSGFSGFRAGTQSSNVCRGTARWARNAGIVLGPVAELLFRPAPPPGEFMMLAHAKHIQ